MESRPALPGAHYHLPPQVKLEIRIKPQKYYSSNTCRVVWLKLFLYFTFTIARVTDTRATLC